MDETTAFETLRHMLFNLGLRKQFHPSMMPLQVINSVCYCTCYNMDFLLMLD